MDYNIFHNYLIYDSAAGRLVWKKRPSNSVNVGDFAGGIDKSSGYRRVYFKNKHYKEHRIIWFIVYGYSPENDIDHINRQRSDNRIENLREVSRKCNLRNTGNFKNSKTIKGVLYHKKAKKWMAEIGVNNKIKYLGVYSSFCDAVCARLAAEQCLDWDGCDSFSPAFRYVKEVIV